MITNEQHRTNPERSKKMIRIAHYLNQFFAGIGGEDQADIRLATLDGPKGPGTALERAFEGRGSVVCTLYAGDNYAQEFNDEFLKSAATVLERVHPDVLVAGPAFNAGRYGLAITPSAIPPIGEGRLYYRRGYNRWLAASILLGILGGLYIFSRSDWGFRLLQVSSRKEELGPPEPMV